MTRASALRNLELAEACKRKAANSAKKTKEQEQKETGKRQQH